MSLNSGETLQPFKPLNQLIYDSAGNLIGIQNDRANGSDLRIGGGSGVDGTFATLVATTALNLNSGAKFDLYHTADQTTNYERLRVDWSGNAAQVFTTAGGTGAARSFRVGVGAVGATTPTITSIQFNTTPNFISLSTTSSNNTSNSFVAIAPGQHTASSSTQTSVSIAPTINQSGTAGYTALDINPTETTTGSGTKLLQRWAVGGTAVAQIDKSGVAYAQTWAATNALAFSTTVGGTGDVLLVRDAADTLALRRSTNHQTFRVYNTYTDGSNYRRWNLSWNTTTAIMQVVGAGTGTNGNLAVGNAALATTDTVGYFMIPSSAGAPTGVPADIPTGQVALHFDSTNNKLYVYDGGWLSTAALT